MLRVSGVSELTSLQADGYQYEYRLLSPAATAGKTGQFLSAGWRREQLEDYIENARSELTRKRVGLAGLSTATGGQMSRQGFWKIIKFYGDKAGIESDITPHTPRAIILRHTWIGGGADKESRTGGYSWAFGCGYHHRCMRHTWKTVNV